MQCIAAWRAFRTRDHVTLPAMPVVDLNLLTALARFCGGGAFRRCPARRQTKVALRQTSGIAVHLSKNFALTKGLG
jgi:hypothetical protein